MKYLMIICLVGICFYSVDGFTENQKIRTHERSFSLKENSKANLDPRTSHHLHRAGTLKNDSLCEIPYDSLNTSDPASITCWLDVEELDLFFNGIDLTVDLPAGACDYFIYEPFWFYQWPVGRTDDEINIYEKPLNDNGQALCTGTCSFRNSDGMTVSNVSCDSLINESSNPEFYFNHTNKGGPNCDEGHIKVQTFSFKSTGGGNCATSNTPYVQVTEGGGDYSKCWNSPAGGPSNPLTPLNLQGFPSLSLTNAYEGLTKNYRYIGPIANNFNTNKIIANYTRRAGAGGLTAVPDKAEKFSFGWPIVETYYSPERIIDYVFKGRNPSNDLPSPGYANSKGVTMAHDPWWRPKGRNSTPSPFYEFSCVNRAYELMGRIRLQVREINENFDVKDINKYALYKTHIKNSSLDFMDSDGPQHYPVYHPLNDFPDWDDDIFSESPSNIDMGAGSLKSGIFSTPIFQHPESNL